MTTIAGLKLCNEAQNELIINFEDYRKKVSGEGLEAGPAEDSSGYGAEIGYLQARRRAVDSLIAAVQRYSKLSDSLSSETRDEEGVVPIRGQR